MTKIFAIAAAAIVVVIAGASVAEAGQTYNDCGGYKAPTPVYNTYVPTYTPIYTYNYNYNTGY